MVEFIEPHYPKRTNYFSINDIKISLVKDNNDASRKQGFKYRINLICYEEDCVKSIVDHERTLE